jgi:hypothetical protein
MIRVQNVFGHAYLVVAMTIARMLMLVIRNKSSQSPPWEPTTLRTTVLYDMFRVCGRAGLPHKKQVHHYYSSRFISASSPLAIDYLGYFSGSSYIVELLFWQLGMMMGKLSTVF